MPTDYEAGGSGPLPDFREIETLLRAPDHGISQGQPVGQYVILESLGQGAKGAVFKARHAASGRVVALTILSQSLDHDREAFHRVRCEIEAARRLNHPNVVAAIDLDEDRGVHFVVMDYVFGRDLGRVVGDCGPMPVAQSVDCVIQAARGLEAAHSRGLIHGDIKPTNLMLDTAGTVRVLDLGLAQIERTENPINKTASGGASQTRMFTSADLYLAPEQGENGHPVDHRADIYSLACTLYFLLSGHEPRAPETVVKSLAGEFGGQAPALRPARPDVSPALEACYQKMMARRPADRPRSMKDVIALLETTGLVYDDVTAKGTPPPRSRPEVMVVSEQVLARAGQPTIDVDPAIRVRSQEREGWALYHELSVEDPVADVGSRPAPAPLKPQLKEARPRKRIALPSVGRQSRPNRAAFVALTAASLLAAALVGLTVSYRRPAGREDHSSRTIADTKVSADTQSQPLMPVAQLEPEPRSLFDGTSGKGWMLCNRAPVRPQNIQPDGLNPHGTGSYLVVYDQKLGDFVLELDYKLTTGCNSGVFLRVSDLNNPVQTGIEVALDDIRHGDDRDSGGFYGLIAPKIFAQKPAGQWNHMTITAQGPNLAVSLNETEVCSINLDLWMVPGKRPDGSSHRWSDRAVARNAQTGYLGFQDLGGDCWFKNIVLKSDTGGQPFEASSSSNRGDVPANLKNN
jgi:serine/threonine protein kinase